MVALYDDDDDDDDDDDLLLVVAFLSHRIKAYGCVVYITWTCTDTGCTSPLHRNFARCYIAAAGRFLEGCANF